MLAQRYIEFVRAHGLEPRGLDLEHLVDSVRQEVHATQAVPSGSQFYTLLYNKRKAIETIDHRQPARTTKQKATHEHLVRMRDLLQQLDALKNQATEQRRHELDRSRITRKRPGMPLTDAGADDESSEAKRQRLMGMGEGVPAGPLAAAAGSGAIMAPMASAAAAAPMTMMGDSAEQQMRSLGAVLRDHLGRSQTRMDHMTDTLVKVSSLLEQIARSVHTIMEQVQHAQQQHHAAAAAAQQSQAM